MTKRLSIFEFVANKNISDIISEFLRDFSLIEAIDPSKLQQYNRAAVIQQANNLINKLKQDMDRRPLPNFESAIQPDYIKLQNLVTKAMRELEPEFKELEFLLAHNYPQYFQNRQDLLQAGKLANIESPSGNNETILPLDPETPTTTIDAPIANQISKSGQHFDNALGIQGIKNLGKVKTQ